MIKKPNVVVGFLETQDMRCVRVKISTKQEAGDSKPKLVFTDSKAAIFPINDGKLKPEQEVFWKASHWCKSTE